MTTELRCEGTLHAVLSDDHQTLEVKCNRRKCGAGPGIVILHTIRLSDGEVVNTQRFSEPRTRKA